MKLAIMQPYLFPYIGYFQLMNAVDKFVMYDDVNFIKKGWINRNNILVEGKAKLFSVPLVDISQNKRINEIYLSKDQKWQQTFLKTLEQNYKKAPYFLEVYPLIEKIILSRAEKINELVLNSFSLLNNYLDIKTTITPTSGIYDVSHLRGQERIIAICKMEKASHYINPYGGQELYSKSVFEKENIELHFLKSEPVIYGQFNKKFVPWLSIIDVMMFNSKQTIASFLGQYTLISNE